MHRKSNALKAFFVAAAATCILPVARVTLFPPEWAGRAPLTSFLVAVLAAALWAGYLAGGMATLMGAAVGTGLVLMHAQHVAPLFLAWRIFVFLVSGCVATLIIHWGQSRWKILWSWRRPLHLRIRRRAASDDALAQRQRLAIEVRRRQEAERALREQAERTRIAVESAEIGTWDIYPRTKELETSDRCKVAFGFAPDATVSYSDYIARIHPADREPTRQAVEAALDPKGPGVYEAEYRVILPDGAVRWLVAKGQAYFGGDRATPSSPRFIGTVVDITPRKQAELAVRQAEERFRSLATFSPVGIFQTDPLGRCVFVNHTWCQIVGAQPEEADDEKWQQFVHPDDMRRVARDWAAAAAQGIDIVAEFRFVNKAAGIRWVSAAARPIRDILGTVTGYVGTIVDITDRRAAENIVRASQAQLQSILDHTTAVIYLKDLQGRYILINRQWELLFHRPLSEVVGRTTKDLFPQHTAEQFQANDRTVIESNKPIAVEEVVPQEDGPHTYLTVKFPVTDGQGAIVAIGGISTDITDRKQAQEALEAEQELMRHTIEIQDHDRQLIAYEIHDGLVQYVTGALMQLESLATRVAPGDAADSIEQISGILRRAVAEGRRLINGIRTPVLDDWGVVPAIQQLLDEEERAHVACEFSFDEHLERMPSEIEEALYRITQEALTNIHKHSHSPRIKIELRRDEDRVRLRITDWGIGFSVPKLSKGVHGLQGMSKRAKIAGGSCTIHSEPGEGTSVVVDLPYLPRSRCVDPV